MTQLPSKPSLHSAAPQTDRVVVSDFILSKLKQKRSLKSTDITLKNFHSLDKRHTIDEFLANDQVKMFFFGLLFPTGYQEYVNRDEVDSSLFITGN